MTKFFSKTFFKVLIVIIFAAAVTLGYFTREQWLANEPTVDKSAYKSASLGSISAQTALTLSNDTNWAGYIVASDIQTPQADVTSVSASWTVPEVKISSQDTFSAVWIGIGGFFDNTLIQTGTEQDSIQGQSQYSAWLEVLPRTSLTIDNITVSPGDLVSASIELIDPNTDQWSVSIRDLTNNQAFTTSIFYAASQLSAEWIVERPEISSTRSHFTLAPLADVGAVKFTDCQATIGGTNGTVSSFPTVISVMYQTVQGADTAGVTQLAAVSNLSGNGSSFTVETSPSVIPELSVFVLLLLVVATGLFAFAAKKRMRGFL